LGGQNAEMNVADRQLRSLCGRGQHKNQVKSRVEGTQKGKVNHILPARFLKKRKLKKSNQLVEKRRSGLKGTGPGDEERSPRWAGGNSRGGNAPRGQIGKQKKKKTQLEELGSKIERWANTKNQEKGKAPAGSPDRKQVGKQIPPDKEEKRPVDLDRG